MKKIKTILSKYSLEDYLMLLAILICSSFYILSTFKVGSLCIFGLALITYFFAFKQNGYKIKFSFTELHFFILLFGIYSVLTSLWAISMNTALARAGTIISMFIFLMLLYPAYSEYCDVEKLINALKWSGYIVILGAVIYYGPFEIMTIVATGDRISNDYLNSNTLGLVAATSILIEIYHCINRKKFKWTVLLLIPSSIVLVGSGSKKAFLFLAMGTAIVILLIDRKESWKDKLKKIVILLLAFLIAFYIIMTLDIFDSISTRIEAMIHVLMGQREGEFSTNIRIDLISIGWEQFKETPLLGIGIDNTRFLSLEQLGYDYYLHNNYIEVLAGEGLIGFVLYYMPYVYIGCNFFKYRKNGDKTYSIIIALFALQLIMDMGQVSYYSKETYFNLLIFYIYMRRIRLEENKKDWAKQMTNLLKKGLRFLIDKDYRFLVRAEQGAYDNWTDEEFLKKKYAAIMGENLNLEVPRTFNEKLQWLKLYNRRPEYTIYVDKYKVREYVAKKIGEDYLIPLLGVWDSPAEIDFSILPNKFVLKCNHNSGLGMKICTDKAKLDVHKVKKDLKRGMDQNYYLIGREWPYKNVPKKIIAEKYMENKNGEEGLNDYKFYCFSGRVEFVMINTERFSKGGAKADYVDREYNRLEMKWGYDKSEELPSKPEKFSKMIELAEKLSEGIPHVRVDLYFSNGRIYFGEMTFFDGSGFAKFEPKDWDYILGAKLKLPEKEE